MVFLVLTRSAYDELCIALGKVPSPIWLAEGVLGQAEIDDLRGSGVVVTNFDYSVNPDNAEGVEDMFSTVALHHPGQAIWVEKRGDA